MNEDERLVLERIAERMRHGRKQYGHLDVAREGMDWLEEATQELLDGCVYLASENIKLARRFSLESGSKTCYTSVSEPRGAFSHGLAKRSKRSTQNLKRKYQSKRRLVERYREPCERLWRLQDELRRDALGVTSSLVATEKRLMRIASLLHDGITEAECEAVLRQYAKESRERAETARWFNGDTNWRPDNFDRALGAAQVDKPDELDEAIKELNAKNAWPRPVTSEESKPGR